jgi:hypothetical protein
MKKIFSNIFNLDEELSIWVEEEDLGGEKFISHHHYNIYVKIPAEINHKKTLRLIGLGKSRSSKIGDLYLHIWLNKGRDANSDIWLSETSSRNGAEKTIIVDGNPIILVFPPNCHHGSTIRYKGLGNGAYLDPQAPVNYHRARGDLYVKLFVFADRITPKYQSIDYLSDDDFVLECKVFQKIDDLITKLSSRVLPVQPIPAETIADQFNEGGFRGIFHTLVSHLNLTNQSIDLAESTNISEAGKCQLNSYQKSTGVVVKEYRITINSRFLDNPFSIAAILAHELCHIIYLEWVAPGQNYPQKGEKSKDEILEIERTVDLLVLLFQLGESQLRVAREIGVVLGYYNQPLFERLYVIVSRKISSGISS